MLIQYFLSHLICMKYYKKVLYSEPDLETQKEGITVGKIQGHDEPLLTHLKQKKQLKYYLSYQVILLLHIKHKCQQMFPSEEE